MDMRKYQEFTRSTAIYPKSCAIPYCVMGLCSEAGEVAGKVKKAYRDADGVISEERRAEISSELGDVLWYLARLSDELGLDLGGIAEQNAEKLLGRKDRGKLSGSGDNR